MARFLANKKKMHNNGCYENLWKIWRDEPLLNVVKWILSSGQSVLKNNSQWINSKGYYLDITPA